MRGTEALIRWPLASLRGARRPILLSTFDRAGVRCRYMIPETRRVLTLMRQRGRTQNRALSFSVLGEVIEYIRQFFSPNSRYFVFTFRDPRPFFADMAFVIRNAVRRIGVLRRRSGGDHHNRENPRRSPSAST